MRPAWPNVPHSLKTGPLLQHKKTPRNIVDLSCQLNSCKSRHSAHHCKIHQRSHHQVPSHQQNKFQQSMCCSKIKLYRLPGRIDSTRNLHFAGRSPEPSCFPLWFEESQNVTCITSEDTFISISYVREMKKNTQGVCDCIKIVAINLLPSLLLKRKTTWGMGTNSIRSVRVYLHAQVPWHCAWWVDFGHPETSHALESLVPGTLCVQSPSSRLPTSQLNPAISKTNHGHNKTL